MFYVLTRVAVVLAALFALLQIAETADAAVSGNRAAPTVRACEFDGIVNAYFSLGEDVDLGGEDFVNEFETYQCKAGIDYRLRIYKAVADTEWEYAELIAFAAASAREKYPTAFCPTGDVTAENSAYLIDMSYFYYASMKVIRPVERKTYKGWLERYASANDCTVSYGPGARTPSTCWKSHGSPKQATQCRRDGWTVEKRFTINPHGAARTTFDKCKYEDSRRCYWNARIMGNGHGDSFINAGDLGRFYSLIRINGKAA